MKSLLSLVLAVLLPAVAIAKGTQVTGTGGDPIPINFSAATEKSRVSRCDGNVIEVINQTGSILGFGIGTETTVPASDYAFIPAGPGAGGRFKPKGGMSSGQYLYIRSTDSPLTSLSVFASCFNEEKP